MPTCSFLFGIVDYIPASTWEFGRSTYSHRIRPLSTLSGEFIIVEEGRFKLHKDTLELIPRKRLFPTEQVIQYAVYSRPNPDNEIRIRGLGRKWPDYSRITSTDHTMVMGDTLTDDALSYFGFEQRKLIAVDSGYSLRRSDRCIFLTPVFTENEK